MRARRFDTSRRAFLNPLDVVLHNADCLVEMGNISDGSIDLILCDLPYGTTACRWDVVIPFEPLWAHYKRVIKPRGAIVLTATQPFTSALVMSNPGWFKYRWIWQKTRPGGFVSAKLKPLKDSEDICVFSEGTTANGSSENMPYYPQGVKPGREWSRPQRYLGSEGIRYARPSHRLSRKIDGEGYPREIIKFANPNRKVLHPTQKPVPLMEYMIRTYTNEGETVLDNAMGSGTTGVACVNTGRKFIGIEIDPGYFRIAQERIAKAQAAKEELLPLCV